MINLDHKEHCCGCNACSSACNHGAIRMQEDEEGFLYPALAPDLCMNCGRCENVCPCTNNSTVLTKVKERKCFAVKNPNLNIRLQSSSGGVFSLIAERVIHNGGVVFGARWDDSFNVIHDYTESVEGLSALRGSKYVQSYIGNAFCQTKEFLRNGREVLFSGTPCQILGLKKYLNKDYEKLICLDIACHGVPSPKVWSSNLSFLGKGIPPISVNMREKNPGWKSYSISYKFEGVKKIKYLRVNDSFMCGYLAGLYTRPSCHVCPAKPNKGLSDLTLADFWGISQLGGIDDDDKGTSMVIVNTLRGMTLLNDLEVELKEYNYSDVVKYNPSIERSSKPSESRQLFWSRCKEENIGIVVHEFGKRLRPSRWIRLKMFIYNWLFR